MIQFYLTVSLIFSFFQSTAYSHPWISNRFSQNCAGCHAPGRVNLPFKDRRCTLSCQGCHVNPHGGGLRNSYGGWTQSRWLRSYKHPFFDHKDLPSPYSRQLYAETVKSVTQNPNGPSQGKSSEPQVEPQISVSPLRTNPALEVNESEYDKYSDTNWNKTAETKAEFLKTIPLNDPYRLERQRAITGGGDLRYFSVWRFDGFAPSNRKFNYWLMSADFGLRVRPIPEKFSFVFESRFLNQPINSGLLQGFTTEARIRSAYALVDDLQYNSFAMYGLYRPMFGLYNPDHKALSHEISGLQARSVFNTLSVGTAPNIPFLNVGMIFPTSGTQYSQAKGFVANLGGRWVTLGLSALFSYWKTSEPNSSGVSLNKTMFAFSFGGTLLNVIYNTEFLRIVKEFAPNSSDEGFVTTHHLKYRVWREYYAVLNYAYANLARSLRAGSSSELMFGVKSYLLPGTEGELLFISRKNTDGTVMTKEEAVQLQAHIFF